MTWRILIVEADARFAQTLGTVLHRAGYDVDHAATAGEAFNAAPHDLVLLDFDLPDGDGIEVCRQLRARGDVGIIVLSARREERDRVAGLRSGADDYLVKPVSFAELQARVDAILRRARPRPAGVRVAGRLRVDVDSHEVFIDDEPITLTRKEFDLLTVLVARPGEVVDRETLMNQVWRATWPGLSGSLNVHMATLRVKLGDGARIETVRGVGYRLVGR